MPDGLSGDSADTDVKMFKNAADERYEIWLGDIRVGLVDYYERGGVVVIPHTETLPDFGGRGLASRLVKFALDDIAEQGKKVNPACPFVAVFIKRNPEYAELVSQHA
jgi:predicted GNAT family acetyltransferase